MPPRLSHRKSRQGCQRCKQRKVKCDEEKPICAGCARHNAECIYRDGTESHAAGTATPSSADASDSSTTPKLRTPYTSLDDIDELFDRARKRLLELHLMHHYTSHVAETFSATHIPEIRETWQVDAPSLALRFPFLMNALLALAALHEVITWSRRPANLATSPMFDVTELSNAHRALFTLAIRQQREAVRTLDQEKADAICVTSNIIASCAFRLLPDQQTPQEYAPPVQWLQLAQAVANVTRLARPMLPQNSIMEKIIRSLEPNMNPQATNPTAPRSLFAPILDFVSYPEPFYSPELHHVYERVVTHLAGILEAMQNHEPYENLVRRVLLFGPITPPEFAQLIQERRPRALVLLAYLMALTKKCGQSWWFDGVPEREVYGIQGLLPPEWQWAMEKPILFIQTEPLMVRLGDSAMDIGK